MDWFWILIAISTFLTLLGLLESWAHRRNLQRIPIRIHVNGTRGKSSVTRLIAAGLREGGLKTCAKTTGTLARMILPNGMEFPVFRPSHPNVIEQVRIIRTAAAFEAQAIVLECMAVQPKLQALSEFKLIRATHAVITNARADHLDVMGPTEADVAWALAGMIPPRGRLYTAECRHLAVLQTASADRAATVATVDAEDINAISPADLGRFAYVEHAENVALALKICRDLGVDRVTALRGMWQATPDPGALTAHELEFFGRRIVFVNGFAANDPESTERIWNLVLDRYADVERRIALFNCRADRADRSRQLGEACVTWKPADSYILMGTGTYIFARAAAHRGLDGLKLSLVEDQRIEEVFEHIIEQAGRSALVMGMGNIGGQGIDLVRYFRNRAVWKERS